MNEENLLVYIFQHAKKQIYKTALIFKHTCTSISTVIYKNTNTRISEIGKQN